MTGRTARRELDATEQMRPKQRFGVTLGCVAPRGVPGASPVVIMRPGDGMVGAHSASGVGAFIQPGQNMDRTAGIDVEVIPFIGPDPSSGQHDG